MEALEPAPLFLHRGRDYFQPNAVNAVRDLFAPDDPAIAAVFLVSAHSEAIAAMVYTTSNVFLETLIAAGITHAFVNLGSDHPALLEAIAERASADSSSDAAKKDLKIVTCPNEMVALSCAQGYAQVTGKPAAVIVQ